MEEEHLRGKEMGDMQQPQPIFLTRKAIQSMSARRAMQSASIIRQYNQFNQLETQLLSIRTYVQSTHN